MGMFDYVKCDYPLPDSAMQSAEFQTKDTECEMKRYTITREGKLVKEDYDTEACPEEEMPFFGTPEWEHGGLARLYGCIRTVAGSERTVEIPYDGDLYFHDYDKEVWWEYRATFRDGVVTEMKRISPSLPPATSEPTTSSESDGARNKESLENKSK